MKKYLDIMKTHGLINGCKRVYEQIFENEFYDFINGVDTSSIVDNKTYKEIISKDHDGWMHYQPTYTNTIKKAISALINNLGKEKKVTFIDLGCGKGKPLLIAREMFNECELIGVDINEDLLKINSYQ